MKNNPVSVQKMKSDVFKLQRSAGDADFIYQKNLKRQFGARAGVMRYSGHKQFDVSTQLAYARKVKADKAMANANERLRNHYRRADPSGTLSRAVLDIRARKRNPGPERVTKKELKAVVEKGKLRAKNARFEKIYAEFIAAKKELSACLDGPQSRKYQWLKLRVKRLDRLAKAAYDRL